MVETLKAGVDVMRAPVTLRIQGRSENPHMGVNMGLPRLVPRMRESDRQGLGRCGWVPIGLRTFFRIIEAWGLSEEEGASLLGFDHKPSESDIGIDPLKRVSHTLGIYRALHILIPSTAGADGWIKKPNDNPLFDGKSAIEYMLANGLNGIKAVRKYLFAELNCW
jgi:hypothetical protein